MEDARVRPARHAYAIDEAAKRLTEAPPLPDALPSPNSWTLFRMLLPHPAYMQRLTAPCSLASEARIASEKWVQCRSKWWPRAIAMMYVPRGGSEPKGRQIFKWSDRSSPPVRHATSLLALTFIVDGRVDGYADATARQMLGHV